MNPLKFNARNEETLNLYINQSPRPVHEKIHLYQAKLTRTEIFENQIEDDDDFMNTLEELTSYKPNLDESQCPTITKSIEDMVNGITDYTPIAMTSDSENGATPVKRASRIFSKMVTSSPVKRPEVPKPGDNVRKIVRELQDKEPFLRPVKKLTSIKKLPKDHPEMEPFIPSVKKLAEELQTKEPFTPASSAKKSTEAVKRTTSSVKRMAEMFNVKIGEVLKKPMSGGYKKLDNSLTPPPARPPPPVIQTASVSVVKRQAPKPPVPRPRSSYSSECDSDTPKPKPTPRKSKSGVISPKIRENMKIFEKSSEVKPVNPLKNTRKDDQSYETLSVKEKIDLFNKFLSELDKNSPPSKKLPRQQQLILEEKKMQTPKKAKVKTIGKISSPFKKCRRVKHSLFVPTSKRKTIESKNERLASIIDDAPPHKKRHIRVEMVPSRKFLKSQYLENLFHQWLQDNQALQVNINQGNVSKPKPVSLTSNNLGKHLIKPFTFQNETPESVDSSPDDLEDAASSGYHDAASSNATPKDSETDFDFKKPERPPRKKKMRKTLTWKKDNSYIENLTLSQTDSDSDYKPNSSIKRSSSFMKNSFDISSRELKDKLELCMNSPRKFKSTYTLTAMSTPSSATDVDTTTRRDKIKLSSIPKMVSELDDRPSTPSKGNENPNVQLNLTDQGFETASNATPIKKPALASSTPLRPDLDGSYVVTRRPRAKEQVNNGSPRMGKSMFWISCKGQKMEFEVAYNSEERLKYILDRFIEKKAMTGVEITFGIDDYCFKNYQIQSGADKNSSFSEYWIQAGDIRFPFRGQYIPRERIFKVFELFCNSSSTVCFGVDSVDFFSVIDMVDYSSPKFSIDSNYSMLIGCSPGGGWPRQYRPASMASKTSDLASEFESELDICSSYIEAFDRLSIGSNLDNPLVSSNNTLEAGDNHLLTSLNSSLIGMKDAMDEAISQWTNIHEGFKEFVQDKEIDELFVESPKTPEIIKKINRLSKEITDIVSKDCDYNDFSVSELEGFADFLGKNLRATMQPYMKNMSDIMDVLLNRTLGCEEVSEC